MRIVTRSTALDLQRCVLKHKGALLVRVTLEARGVGAHCEPRLFQLKAAVRIMAIAAVHRALQHPVMEWTIELRFRLVMTLHAELRFALDEHLSRVDVVCVGGEGPNRDDGRGGVAFWLDLSSRRRVRRVTVGAAYVIAPVFASAEVVVLLFSRVARQTVIGDLCCGLTFECSDFGFVTSAIDVRLAGSVTRLAALPFGFPTGLGQSRVRGLRETGELSFVAGFASFAANVVL